MEIKKADSKGRVSGFEPGQYYEIYEAGNKTYFAIYQYGFSVGKEADMGTAEEAEMLLNQAMAKKNAPK